MSDEAVKVVATNRKAQHDFFLEDRVEAGMALQGSEIKSVRAGQISLREAYVKNDGREVWLINAHIAPYEPANRMNHEPRRPRRLLLHRREITRLFNDMRQKGLTLIPTRVYLARGRAKVEIALARGKKKYDKREEIARRESERDLARVLRRRGGR
ncbi:MAG: SsrA-binding protein [Chloroflexi bacterium RBG_13_68_17]|nr:MAG: SsrA-binding protein [Chloroflexi bacterium RBG_13_68_17]